LSTPVGRRPARLHLAPSRLRLFLTTSKTLRTVRSSPSCNARTRWLTTWKNSTPRTAWISSSPMPSEPKWHSSPTHSLQIRNGRTSSTSDAPRYRHGSGTLTPVGMPQWPELPSRKQPSARNDPDLPDFVRDCLIILQHLMAYLDSFHGSPGFREVLTPTERRDSSSAISLTGRPKAEERHSHRTPGRCGDGGLIPVIAYKFVPDRVRG
jgi:hypothetical protein